VAGIDTLPWPTPYANDDEVSDDEAGVAGAIDIEMGRIEAGVDGKYDGFRFGDGDANMFATDWVRPAAPWRGDGGLDVVGGDIRYDGCGWAGGADRILAAFVIVAVVDNGAGDVNNDDELDDAVDDVVTDGVDGAVCLPPNCFLIRSKNDGLLGGAADAAAWVPLVDGVPGNVVDDECVNIDGVEGRCVDDAADVAVAGVLGAGPLGRDNGVFSNAGAVPLRTILAGPTRGFGGVAGNGGGALWPSWPLVSPIVPVAVPVDVDGSNDDIDANTGNDDGPAVVTLAVAAAVAVVSRAAWDTERLGVEIIGKDIDVGNVLTDDTTVVVDSETDVDDVAVDTVAAGVVGDIKECSYGVVGDGGSEGTCSNNILPVPLPMIGHMNNKKTPSPNKITPKV
jgi:hypothetical protein